MHKNYSDNTRLLFGGDLITRHFFKFFKSKKKQVELRTGAMDPAELKRKITEIGTNKKVNIQRIEYDGTPEQHPITLRISNIYEDYFTGQIVNVERSIKQEMDTKLVYVKGGGGTIEFYYNDGDVLSVEEDIDETIFDERDPNELLEILGALDLNESILISYYDKRKSGVMNGIGLLKEKDLEAKTFSVELTALNDITLEQPKRVNLDLDTDKVLDLEVML